MLAERIILLSTFDNSLVIKLFFSLDDFSIFRSEF